MNEQPPSPLLVAISRWYWRTTIVIAVLTGWPRGEFRIRFLSAMRTQKVVLLLLLLIAFAVIISRFGMAAGSAVTLLSVLVVMIIAAYILWWSFRAQDS